jgi:2-polyprenyl-6-methoxyphenol hydroxylase-like FAD-dependent oxidoreductase
MRNSASRAEAPHAIVIGASIAGLLAARVLSDHFRKVTLIERDRLSAGWEPRKGVPQGCHIHALLARGEQVLSGLFPGLTEALLAGGAVPVDLANDIRWYQFGSFKVRFPSALVGLCQSRPFLEGHIRQRVLSLKNVDCRPDTEVLGVLATSDGRRLTGVRVRDRQSAGELCLYGSLAVDATGRGSASPKWLQQLGYPRPRESVIAAKVGYASRTYRRRREDLNGAKLVVVLPTPPHETRMGAVVPIEGDRWMVSLGGVAGDHPPKDEPGFLAFARSLPIPDVADLLRRAEPLSPITMHKFPWSVRRHYEDMERFPEGFLIVGDALCSFNPVYGQGMTVSALEAEALDFCLREKGSGLPPYSRSDLGPRFFRKVSSVVDLPWRLAASADVRYPNVDGPRTWSTTLFNWYLSKLHGVTAHDPAVHRQFIKVINLMDPPISLLRPPLPLRVLQGSLVHRVPRHRPA